MPCAGRCHAQSAGISFPGALPLSGRSASPPGHQINVGSRLEERIGRGFDAIHSGDGIEDNVLLLPGVVRSDFVQTDLAECALGTLLGPADRGIIDSVTVLGQLYGHAKPDGFLCNSLFDLVEEEVWTARGGFGVSKIFVAWYRQHPIAPVAAHAVPVGKLECGYREERLPRKAGRDRLGNLHKCHRRGMRAEELLDAIRVRPGSVGGNQCVEELEESFRGARREVVDRMTDDVGVSMLAEVEANCKPARAGTL